MSLDHRNRANIVYQTIEKTIQKTIEQTYHFTELADEVS